ncbi:transcriptional regulatory protein AlgQ [Marinobacterium nitratireducens]|uniref:Transcriptional regulatory protein AlgQ n=1 Tax=Marinobacterium nitratireducens TaxID=518897 RepID=A0A917ZNB0_9GAMM|nr:sigma D regulator [Marinobacterium nitratireducens]GGO87880.1 transcriptional regulatory protein AlgQ [Marinobacterium nitratireducens]
MLEQCRNSKERWGGVSEIIDHLLEERQQLISHFVALPSLKVNQALKTNTEAFCDVLMDYLSSGHFEVYEQLLREGSEFDDGSLEKAQKLFPRIQDSTDYALDFNDNGFGHLDDPTVQQIREFADQLSRLGEKLEERFELEDRMIEILHTSHRDLVMTED